MDCAGLSLQCTVEEVARDIQGEPENVVLRSQGKKDLRREQSVAFNATEKAK